jgi:delta(3,5)-delta(2,4)-dienoyl-CoA isomerase
MVECFQAISEDNDCRVVIISGNGKHFTAGLDLTDMGPLMETVLGDDDIARKFRTLQQFIKRYQLSFTSIEQVWLFVFKSPRILIGKHLLFYL